MNEGRKSRKVKVDISGVLLMSRQREKGFNLLVGATPTLLF